MNTILEDKIQLQVIHNLKTNKKEISKLIKSFKFLFQKLNDLILLLVYKVLIIIHLIYLVLKELIL